MTFVSPAWDWIGVDKYALFKVQYVTHGPVTTSKGYCEQWPMSPLYQCAWKFYLLE